MLIRDDLLVNMQLPAPLIVLVLQLNSVARIDCDEHPSIAEATVYPLVRYLLIGFNHIRESNVRGDDAVSSELHEQLLASWPLTARNSIRSAISVDIERGQRSRHLGPGLGRVMATAPCWAFKNAATDLSLVTISEPTVPDEISDENAAKFYLMRDDRLLSTMSYKSVSVGDVGEVANGRLYVVIHGVFERFTRRSWMTRLMARIAAKTNDSPTFLVVDWAERAANLFVNKLAANAKAVGVELFSVLRQLAERNVIATSNVLMIGYNLGAQVAGIAANRLRRQNLTVARVIALDPADHCFDSGLFERVGDRAQIADKLTPYSASRVIAVHSSATSIGTLHKVGHLDIFANRGHGQPGCEQSAFDIRSCE